MATISFDIDDNLNEALKTCGIDIQQRLTLFSSRLQEEVTNIVRSNLSAQIAAMPFTELVAQQATISISPVKAVLP